jgi:hypothetical protein
MKHKTTPKRKVSNLLANVHRSMVWITPRRLRVSEHVTVRQSQGWT